MSGPGDPPPPIQLHSPAVDFMETRLREYHPVFASDSAVYDPATDRFISHAHPPVSDLDPMALVIQPSGSVVAATEARSPVQALPLVNPASPTARPLPPGAEAMGFWDLIWPEAMTRLKETKEASSRKERFSIRSAKSWRDVTEILEKARMEYERLGRDSKLGHVLRKFKRSGRRVGETVATPIQQVIKVMPNHPIATPVLGAVNLLMNAWKETAKVRKELVSNFDEATMNYLFADINLYSEMFKDDENITIASTSMLLTIFKAAEGAIGFYTSWKVSRVGKLIFQGDEYLQPLRQSLQQIKADGDHLEKQAMKSFQYWQMKHSQDNTTRQNETKQDIKRLTNNVDIMMVAVNNAYPLFREQADQRNAPQQESRLLPSAELVSLHSKESRAPTPEPKMLPESLCTPQHLLDLVDSPNTDEEDMDVILDRADGFLPEDRVRAEQVVSTSKFRDWILNRKTTKLMIHGDFDLPEYSEISPLSVLCSILVKALRIRPEFISLVFFCGRHLIPDDENSIGAGAIMRSFITQLLNQCPSACPASLGSEITPSRIEDGGLDKLVKLFFALAHQIPPSATLVIFIDGVLLYERPKFCDGLHEVIGNLIELADNDKQMHITVKILLTSAQETSTKELGQVFRLQDAIFSMKSMHDSGQGPSRSAIVRELEQGFKD